MVEPPCWCFLIKHGGGAWGLIRALQPRILLECTSACHKFMPGGRFFDSSFQQPAPLRVEGNPRFSTAPRLCVPANRRQPAPPVRPSLMSSLFRTGCHHNFPTRTQFPPCVSACAAPPLLSSTGLILPYRSSRSGCSLGKHLRMQGFARASFSR